MLQTKRSYAGMITAPHHLAAHAGLRVLEDGGNAIEAMIAAAATIAVVYPHMNALGGDNFWLISEPGKAPFGISACGRAAGLADPSYYFARNLEQIPSRGPLAALTVAGAVSGWAAAFDHSRSQWEGTIPLVSLLEDAIFHAEEGVAVTKSLADALAQKHRELAELPGFAAVFLNGGNPWAEGERLRQPALAVTLERLADEGLHSFYRGKLSKVIAADLQQVGSLVRLSDLEEHQATQVEPLGLEVNGHQVFNLPPPTQGLASLMLLGLFDRLGVREADGFAHIHGIVEATKAAFRIRDRHITDPDYMSEPATDFLQPSVLDRLAAGIDPARAASWPAARPGGDTVWLGAIDAYGRAVSFIQSIYWEFGSGVVLPETGIMWQNRGTSFSLDVNHHNCLKPQRRPFHTIQPALARLADGRTMVYGTMGGDGQPQTQAAIFSRHVLFNQPLQQAINAPRWLLGRTWGDDTPNLKLEDRFDPAVVEALRAAGHEVELVAPFDEMMGHAGALVLHQDGLMEGATDPRSDGAVGTR